MGSADPSQSGVDKHKGTAAGGRPGPAPSRGGGVRASEGTNPCTRPSFATKNVFDVLQDLSESIGGSPGPQLDAADGQPEPIVHDLHQSLVELLERPEILSLHAVRRVGRERQLHLKVRALCGEVEKVFDVLVDTGAQVSLVKAGLLPPECLTDSRKPVRLKVANGQYMVGGTKEAAIGLQFVNHRELSRPDLGKEILLHGSFYEAEMDWDMIVGYDFMMETDSGVLPAQASMTLYQDDQLSWLSSPEHHVECQWIHPERNQLEVAALDTEPTGPANQEYGVGRKWRTEWSRTWERRIWPWMRSLQEPPPICGYVRSTGAPRTPRGRSTGVRSGIDVDPLPPLGHSKSDSEDSQGPLQGSAGCSYGMHRGGKYPTLGSLIDQHDLEQGRPTGWRECLSGR